MSKLQYWEGFKAWEIRGIPVICKACGNQVSVNGDIVDGELVFDCCPSCDAPIEGMLYMQGEQKVGSDTALIIGAEIKWITEGGIICETSIKIRNVVSVPSLLMSVLESGVKYYAYPGLTRNRIYRMMAHIILGKAMPQDDARETMEELKAIFDVTPEVAPADEVDELNGTITLDEILGEKPEETENNDDS